MTTANETTSVQESSGNVFADLGLCDPEERLVKAELASLICRIIDAQGLTPTKAAKTMGLDQLKISALMRGRLKEFSTQCLLRCLNDLGQEVEILIRPVQQAGRRGNIRVAAATE